MSPAKFEAQATGSPTKPTVVNRKVRNQPSNRIHDIEFAAEISTSLIAQVRNLQGLLAEKEEELKDTRAENSKLEYEVEGFQQRLKSLDDSEQRYKDENWNLETQIHELMAKEKEAADREKKLTQTLNHLQSEKNAAQRELDEIKLSHSRLAEEHAAAVKHHDIELGTAKRTMVMAESERAAMQKKIEELTGQNTELAKAVSVSMRGRKSERDSVIGMSDDDFQTARDNLTPEESPPPSPIKSTPRHSMLESETLKSSLAHAQRTIQSLRTNVHREKTEKLENRRLLQEARDEIEKLRSEPAPPTRRARKAEPKDLKKPPRLLGGLRSARSEVFLEDPDWEDQPDLLPHPFSSPLAREPTKVFDSVPEHSDHFETANETSDAAFDTAHENVTETDDFHTGIEEFSSDETETESPSKRPTLRGRPSIPFNMQRNGSIDSTATTEDEDFPYDEMRTPPSLPPPSRFPLRVSRGAYRRSRHPSEEPAILSSPPSFVSNASTPQQHTQNLAAELGEFDGSDDDDSTMSATPSRRSLRGSLRGSIRSIRSMRGRTMTPPPAVPAMPRALMVDSGMMTEPLPVLSTEPKVASGDRPMSMATDVSRFSVASDYSESGPHDLGARLAEFPTPPTSSAARELTFVPELVWSTIHSQNVEPLPQPDTLGLKIAALREEHAEQMKSLAAQEASAHEAAVKALRSQHADELASVKSTHLEELEALRSAHADATKKAVADAGDSHAAELESLRTLHSQQLAQKDSENKATYAADVEALKAAHAEELSRAHTERLAVHAAELEALQLAHAEVLTRKESENNAAREAEIEALKSAHAEKLSQTETALKVAALAELEALKTKHAEELSHLKTENETAHATELAALAEAHASKVDSVKKELVDAHARELDKLKSSHLAQIDQAKLSMGTVHSEQLESLKASHLQQIDEVKNSINATHAKELESLHATHSQQLTDTKQETTIAQAAAIASLNNLHNQQLEDARKSLHAAHSEEVQNLNAAHTKQLADLSREKDSAYMALAEAHNKQIGETKDGLSATHTQDLERLKASHLKQLEELEKEKDTAHAAVLAVTVGSHAKQLETQKAESDALMTSEIASLKAAHALEIKTLNAQHAAAHAKELDGFKAALAKQVESSKTEGDAAHSQQIDALNAAHAEIIEAHKRDAEIAQNQALDALKSWHQREIDSLNSDHAAAKTKELGLVTTKHQDELESLKAENAATRSKELEGLANKHLDDLKSLEAEHETSKLQLRQELGVAHSKELESLRQEIALAHSKELESLGTTHTADLEAIKNEHETTMSQRLEELEGRHAQAMTKLQQEGEVTKSEAIAVLGASHAQILDTLKNEHEAELARKLRDASESHAHELNELREQNESDHLRELMMLTKKHQDDLAEVKSEYESIGDQRRTELESTHTLALAALRTEHQTALEKSINGLRAEHLEALEAARSDGSVSQSKALATLEAEHAQRMDQMKETHDALAQEIEALKAGHARALESQAQESSSSLAHQLEALKAQHAQIIESNSRERISEREQLLATHAAELEALRASLAVLPPALEYSTMSSIQTKPVDLAELRSPRREAFIIPQDQEPVTPRTHSNRASKTKDIPIIAEDDTRQSPSALVRSETPDSQQPFKEITTNTDARSSRKPVTAVSHQSSQTTLTAEGLDQLLKPKHQIFAGKTGTPFDESNLATPSTVRRHTSSDSFDSMAHAKPHGTEPSIVITPEPANARRPGSSASARSWAQTRPPLPPLPPNHREAIEAARSNSSHGGNGTMAPPFLPASAYRPSSSRPQTPSNRPPPSPASLARMTPTPRAGRTPGYADVHSPTKMPMRSRQSSISSFASEIDTRFNIHNGMGPTGFGPSTDPRMIQAVTQTMIGEYLWKYTRKTGRGEMSENRHRRFFWVHPYTRALYWSEGDPAAANRGEMKAKSVAIEAVRVVADDNPMPPGLHRKSLVVISPGRTIKFTCTTGQRHETWFNALSYLLLRSGNENAQDAEEVAANMSQEETDEFNPSLHRPSTNSQRPRPPPSLSSYNSRTTRNESPSMDPSTIIPTLTPTHEKDASRNGTFGRLSGYWKSGSLGRNTFSSLRSRSYQPYDSAIYEASEVADSAEDLRQIIEQQDREADRLENVRACCDGKPVYYPPPLRSC